MSLAGGLGVEVDVDAAGPHLASLALLYGESAGRFLLSVAPEQRTALEARFAGLPLTLLGKVRPDQRFLVQRGGRVLLETSVDDLKNAWQRRIGHLV